MIDGRNVVPGRHVRTMLARCGVMLTRAYTRWWFPEVDARLRATLRDFDDVGTDLWDVVKHARKNKKQRGAGGYCDQAEVVSRAAVLSAVQQLRLRPHDGLRGARLKY